MTVLTFDLETASAGELWSYGPGFVRLAGWAEDGQQVRLGDAADVLEAINRAEVVTGHNILGFDFLALARYHGLDIHRLIREGRVVDTLLVARQDDPPTARETGVDHKRRYDLDRLGERYGLGGKSQVTIKKLAKEFGGFDQIPVTDKRFREYLRNDVELSRRLYNQLAPAVDDYVRREHRVAAIAAQISLNGFRVDTKLLQARLAEGEAEKARALELLNKKYGIPLADEKGQPYASPLATKAGKEALIQAFKSLGVTRWPKSKKTGDISTSAESMTYMAEEWGHLPGIGEICRAVATVVKTRTVYQTISDCLVGDRVHPTVSFKQASGRWSLTNPGLTVMGKRNGRWREREVFIPDPGEVIIAVDLSQIDMRALAGLSQDPGYIDLFRSGGDPHSEIALALFGTADRRDEAKAIGHGWNYGRGLQAIIDATGVPADLVYRFDESMRKRFPRLIEWQDEVRAEAESGALLDNGFGRKMRPSPDRSHTQAPALMGQGCARDLMMEGLLRLPEEILPMLRAQVHDEIVLSVPEDIAEDVEREVVKALSFEWRGVPITADGAGRYGRSWGEVYDKSAPPEKKVTVPVSRPDTPADSSDDQHSPFEHADLYRERGWRSTLPLPPRAKKSPPTGYTGYGAMVPDDEITAFWAENPRYAGGNLALRMPETVIGIDVDAYGDKPGAESLAEAEKNLGELPATWRSSSRPDDPVSGIRFYRVPAGRAWANDAGRGIELVHHGHRYAVVWPSIHPEGRVYQWFTPDGGVAGGPPSVAELPELPPTWIEHLDRGSAAERQRTVSARPAEVDAFLAALPDGEPCQTIADRLAEAVRALGNGGSRHDAMRDGMLAILGYGDQGHQGAVAALDRLWSAFEDAVSGTDREGDAKSEWDRALAGAVGKLTPGNPDRQPCQCGEAVDDDVFWSSRPWLRDLRQFAQARMVSPWAMFGCVLALVAARIGPHVQLPAIIGGRSSLNILVGLVGPSGSGKDSALAAARDFLEAGMASHDDSDQVPVYKLGTGQGIASVYTEQTKEGPVQFSDTALFTATEIDTLKAHTEMSGSNLLATLKDVYNAAALGERYATKDKRRPVRPHRYRFALIAGIQPTHAKVLLDDADGGTPQRWLWLPTVDPDRPEVPPPQPEWFMWSPPERLKAQGATDGPIAKPRVIELTVCDAARQETVAIRRAQLSQSLTGDVEDGKNLDGHANLTRLKVASLLALVDHKTEVTDEYWELARLVLARSRATRAVCEKAVTQKSRAENKAAAIAEAEREAVIETEREARVTQRVQRILAAAKGQWVTRSEIRQRVSSRDRVLVDAAIARLLASGMAERQKAYQGGEQYRAMVING